MTCDVVLCEICIASANLFLRCSFKLIWVSFVWLIVKFLEAFFSLIFKKKKKGTFSNSSFDLIEFVQVPSTVHHGKKLFKEFLSVRSFVRKDPRWLISLFLLNAKFSLHETWYTFKRGCFEDMHQFSSNSAYSWLWDWNIFKLSNCLVKIMEICHMHMTAVFCCGHSLLFYTVSRTLVIATRNSIWK